MNKLVIAFVVCLFASLFVAVWEWTDRNIEFLVSKYKGQKVEVNDGLTLVATLVGNGLTIPFNVGVEIYAYAVDDGEPDSAEEGR